MDHAKETHKVKHKRRKRESLRAHSRSLLTRITRPEVKLASRETFGDERDTEGEALAKRESLEVSQSGLLAPRVRETKDDEKPLVKRSETIYVVSCQVWFAFFS